MNLNLLRIRNTTMALIFMWDLKRVKASKNTRTKYFSYTMWKYVGNWDAL